MTDPMKQTLANRKKVATKAIGVEAEEDLPIRIEEGLASCDIVIWRGGIHYYASITSESGRKIKMMHPLSKKEAKHLTNIRADDGYPYEEGEMSECFYSYQDARNALAEYFGSRHPHATLLTSWNTAAPCRVVCGPFKEAMNAVSEEFDGLFNKYGEIPEPNWKKEEKCYKQWSTMIKGCTAHWKIETQKGNVGTTDSI